MVVLDYDTYMSNIKGSVDLLFTHPYIQNYIKKCNDLRKPSELNINIVSILELFLQELGNKSTACLNLDCIMLWYSVYENSKGKKKIGFKLGVEIIGNNE